MGLGVLFTNGSVVLAGVQKKNGQNPQPVVSGFGGKAERGESVSQTAAREVLEEIFDIRPSQEQIAKVESLLLPLPFVRTSDSWSFFVADFVCLTQIYNSVLPQEQEQEHKQTQDLLIYLLFHRKPRAESEILSFCLLPFHTIEIDQEFQSDILLLLNQTFSN